MSYGGDRKYSDDRKSLAQEIAETLRSRGHWVPEDWASADLIMTVAKALDKPKDPHFAVIYTENHPDKCMTLVGVFSDEALVEAAIDKHLAAERARLPHAHINHYCYQVFEGWIDGVEWG